MPRNLADYEEDFYAWTVEQARLLRSGEFLVHRCRKRSRGDCKLGAQRQARTGESIDGAPDAPSEVANTIEDEIA